MWMLFSKMLQRKGSIKVFVVICMLLPNLANAELGYGDYAKENNWDLLLSLGATYGGDNIAEAYYLDENYNVVDDAIIKGGGLFKASIGVDWPLVDDFRIITSAGYHVDSQFSFASTSSGNQGMWFTRFVLEALPYYQISDSFKLGGGLTYHMSNKVGGQFIGSDQKYYARYEDTLGYTGFIGYMLGESRSWLELRYTHIKYDLETAPFLESFCTSNCDGSHVGLIFHWAIL
ncbi:hypothetical protein ACVFI8_19945 [Agarivorans sp. MS3-6]|uniref:hypothetical protein n=1 Tax=Agarivorans sp. TSD2052 TaxID=2937286 RepID=UPI0020105C57|nr:hypothetical protein [Agarivorans sp. TSD2052]UPW16891.1 hypothetical protein M0C34_11600 [Agarivorans sp. TSD2052]